MGTSASKNYKHVKHLGSGSFGSVDLVRHKSTGEVYALKKIKFKTQEQRDKALQEATLLQHCSHPNIVGAISFYQDEGFFKSEIGILMEYCDGGSLVDLINTQRKEKKYFTEKEILDMMMQICDGLMYLHQHHIIHRDMKIDNVLIKEGKLKIADVGVARIMDQEIKSTDTFIGTPLYMAPEIFKGTYDYSVDIYALGCILKELTMLSRIKSHSEDGMPSHYSDTLRNLCHRMLLIDPRGRPSVEEVFDTVHNLLYPTPTGARKPRRKSLFPSIPWLEDLFTVPVLSGFFAFVLFFYILSEWIF